MVCIIFFNLIYKQMEVDNILTSLYIIHGLVEPLFDLPIFFISLFEINISLVRIQNFLSLENHDYSQIEYLSNNENNSDSHYSIIISNADFGVEKKVSDSVNINDKNNINDINNSNDDLNTTNENIDNNSIDSNNEEQQKKNLISGFNNKKKFNDSFDSTDSNTNTEKDYESKIESGRVEKLILLKDINIKILKGEHIGIIGEIGSGKTCLLNAFINNLKVFPKNDNITGNIKLSGKISFVSQNPWILNTTVEENIILFNEKNEERYKKIVSICQLEQDFKSLANGDKTEIGEKGVNLSGGQKARISIARAIYSDAEIYIFDDPLSALDAYVGMNLFKDVFNYFLKEKTVIISTHALQ